MTMRDERERQAAAARRIEAAALVAPRGSDRFVGAVFDGGSMGSCTPCIFLVHPVQLGGTETEGGAGSNAVDTTRAIPVVVLGQVPSVGDLLTVFSAGGRWVAEKGGPGGGCTGEDCQCGIPCDACSGVLLAFAFHATWTDICGHSGSGDAIFDPFWNPSVAPIWFTGTHGVDPDPIFRMSVVCTVDGGLTATIAEPTGTPGVFHDVYSSTLDAADLDCTSGKVSGTFATWTTIDTPSTCTGDPGSLAVSLGTERPEHRLCCLPCGIPKKDLTLTVLGSDGVTTTYTGTITYSSTPSDTWTSAPFYVPSIDDMVTISITCGFDGNLCVDVISTGFTSLSCGGCTGDGSYLLRTATCDPLHATFFPAIGSDPGCVDMITYIYRIIVDEP